MGSELQRLQATANHTRYRTGQQRGHYESFFLRGNHPQRPLAFWIRYTIFSPQRHPEAALGELWAVSFDGETSTHVAVKCEVPFAACAFSPSAFDVRIDRARLRPGALSGAATTAAHAMAWDLTYAGAAAPLLLLPPRLYDSPLPKAKSLVGLPLARFAGTLTVDGVRLDVTDWVGSQNHNWGTRHTDHYAWGQVAGFDTHPDSFLEVGTARLKLGPLWTPFMTVLVLRHRGEELVLNRLGQSLRARASFRYFEWDFATENDQRRVVGRITAPRDSFVGLRYGNPPGGSKHCLNSKLAACELRVTDKRAPGKPAEVLTTAHRAAFEILTDDHAHGVTIRV